MRDNFERVINYATPEGMKRQDELERKRREERMKNPAPNIQGADEVGWGKARPDLTWLDAFSNAAQEIDSGEHDNGNYLTHIGNES